MFRQEVEAALEALGTDRKGLARQLGLAVGSLRAWESRGAPPFARLALAALVAGLEPTHVLNCQARSSSTGSEAGLQGEGRSGKI